MTQDPQTAAALWLAAVLHEVVQPTAAALRSAEQAAEHLENTLAALRRAARRADALRWLVRVLLKDETAAAELSPCSVLSTLRALSPPGPDLRVEVPAHLSVLSAPGVLHLVLGNLIGNARQHASGSLITVRSTTGAAATKWPPDAAVKLRGGVVLLTVSDEGPGIAPDDVPHVFELFFRKKDGQDYRIGRGLGLHFCRLVVEAHGGRITAGNRRMGGALLTVALPVRQEQACLSAS